jgi:hypothetical protein
MLICIRRMSRSDGRITELRLPCEAHIVWARQVHAKDRPLMVARSRWSKACAVGLKGCLRGG